MGKSLIFKSLLLGLALGIVTYGALVPQAINADLKNAGSKISSATLVKNGHLTICKLDKASYQVVRTMKMVFTAYASVPDETDSTPFITASGKHVADGIIATNILPFGTKVMIAGFGNKIFTVEDRMNAKYNGTRHADIWEPTVHQARLFGARTLDVKVVES